jgi:uncharacterized membrane protein
MVIGSAAVAVAMTELDSHISRDLLVQWPRLFGAGTDGSRAMLSAVAGSMVTVATVTFSITMLALSQASSQYSPRLLQRFMSDRPTQIVLGVFVGVFVYCIVVLRTISGGDDREFLPSLSVTIGGALALIAIGFLVYFIHHIASSLQASTIIAAVGKETLGTIDGLLKDAKRPRDGDSLPLEPDDQLRGECVEITATCNGYLTTIDPHALVRIAVEHSAVIRMSLRLGDFVSEGDVLGTIKSSRKIPAPVASDIEGAVATADRRSQHQDPGFGLQQLTDIALKALSPGINDTTTAVMSINYIGAIIRKLAHEEIRPQVFCDKEGRARVHIPYPSFNEYVQGSFGAIRAVATTNVPVLQGLVAGVDRARRVTKNEDRLRSLDRLTEQLRRAITGVPDPDDRKALDQSIQQVRAGLPKPPPL